MGSASSRVDSNAQKILCCLADAEVLTTEVHFDEITGIISIAGEEGLSCYVGAGDFSSSGATSSFQVPCEKAFKCAVPYGDSETSIFAETLSDEEDGATSSFQVPCEKAFKCAVPCGDSETSIFAETLSDEEDGGSSTPIHINADIAQALQDNGDGKCQGNSDSSQSDGLEAATLVIELDTCERAAEQNPVAQSTPLRLEEAAVERTTSSPDIDVESVLEATEKIVVVTGAAMEDVKKTPNLACLASADDTTCSPCEINGPSRSPCKISSHVPNIIHFLNALSPCRRMSSTEKVNFFLNSLSTCDTMSSTEEEQSACFQNIGIDAAAVAMHSQILDGVWLLDEDEPETVVKDSGVNLPVALVQGSDVKLMGDGAPDCSFQLEALGAGVWGITIDDEEFLVDCREREDGRLLLNWSNGQTWVRKEDGIEIDSVSSISSSTSSCSSSSSSSESLPTTKSSVGPVEAGRISEALEVSEANKGEMLSS